MKKWYNKIQKILFDAKNLLLLAILVMLAINICSLAKEIIRMKRERKDKPYVFLGFKFSGLKEILGDVSYIGYITDKNLDNKIDAMQFAQAQYKLAPIILELNGTQHKYVLIDCSSIEVAKEKIKELDLVPIRQNQFGIILARNTNHH